MLFTCQLWAAVVVELVELPDDPVDEVVDPRVVVEVVDVEEVVDDDVVDDVGEVLLGGEATGVSGPGLTCSPAAATICQAMTVVSAVASTQRAIRTGRLTP